MNALPTSYWHLARIHVLRRTYHDDELKDSWLALLVQASLLYKRVQGEVLPFAVQSRTRRI